MRDLSIVMKAVIKKIPDDYSKKKEIESRLQYVDNKYKYASPELHPSIWDMFAMVLNNTLPFPPETQWQKEICDIFADKIDVGARINVGS